MKVTAIRTRASASVTQAAFQLTRAAMAVTLLMLLAACGNSNNGSYDAKASEPPLPVQPTAMPVIDDAVPVRQTLTLDSRITPIVFANRGGGTVTRCMVTPTLPAGLSVLMAGVTGVNCHIEGTPTAVNTQVTTYTVTAVNALGSDSGIVIFNILALQNTINAGNDRSERVNSPGFTQVATGGSSTGVITYTSSNPSIATVNAQTGRVTILAIGVTVITATQAADDTYPETSDSYTLEVLSLPVSVINAGPNQIRTLGDPAFTQAATGGSGTGAVSYVSSNMGVARVNETTGQVTILTAGTTVITATKAGDGNYPSATDSYTLTVNRANQANFDAGPNQIRTFDDPDFTQAATGGSGTGAVSYVSGNPAVASVHETTGEVTILAVGSTVITATKAGDGNYLPASDNYSLRVIANLPLPDLANAGSFSLTLNDMTAPIVFTNNGGGSLSGCAVAPTLPPGLTLSRTTGNSSCQITGTPNMTSNLTSYRVTATNATGADPTPATVEIAVLTCTSVDVDRDGLIDISTLRQLHNMRFNLLGTSYKTSEADPGSNCGCPSSGCFGYELLNDLDFDKDRDGSTWTRSNEGTLALDTGDHDAVHFDTTAGGWMPVGDCGPGARLSPNKGELDCDDNIDLDGIDNDPFNAVFDGRGFSIRNMAIYRDFNPVGFFGLTGSNANIRNLNIEDYLIAKAHKGGETIVLMAGGLVGWQIGGRITACSATGEIVGSPVGDTIGGLVGRKQDEAHITASWASLIADGRNNNDTIGGLVGYQSPNKFDNTLSGGSITASFAKGVLDDGLNIKSGDLRIEIDHVQIGGLVGDFQFGTITASYATANVDASGGNDGEAGGLVGSIDVSGSSSIQAVVTASYATGTVDGGPGDNDRTGALVGRRVDGGGTINDSWGFGVTMNGEITGVNRRHTAAATPSDLTTGTGADTDIPASWNSATQHTLNAWDLGTADEAPALRYADYDGPVQGTGPNYDSGHIYHCDSDSAAAPDDAILIPKCGSLIPGQRETSMP